MKKKQKQKHAQNLTISVNWLLFFRQRLVIFLLLGDIVQNLVSGTDLQKVIHGGFRLIHVRMIDFRQLDKSRLNLFVRGLSRHAQRPIMILIVFK